MADDDPDLRDVVSCILDRLGIDAVGVALGGELLARLAEDGPFDLIVTDVAVPWLTGIKAIHAARFAGSCPVIVMTVLRVTREQVVSLGRAVYVLRKPFSLAQLEAALVVSLGGGPPERRSTSGAAAGRW